MVKYDKRAEVRYAVLAAGMRRTQYWCSSLILATEHLSLGGAIHGRAYMAIGKDLCCRGSSIQVIKPSASVEPPVRWSSAVIVADATLDMPARSILAPSLPSGGS